MSNTYKRFLVINAYNDSVIGSEDELDDAKNMVADNFDMDYDDMQSVVVIDTHIGREYAAELIKSIELVRIEN